MTAKYKFFFSIMVALTLSACAQDTEGNRNEEILNVEDGLSFQEALEEDDNMDMELTPIDLENMTEEMIQTTAYARIYAKPSENASVIGEVSRGTRLGVYGFYEDEEWMIISYNGRIGYVMSEVFERETITNQTVITPPLNNDSGIGNDAGTGDNAETGNNAETGDNAETGNNAGTGDNAETGNDVETENDSETGNDVETENDSETGNDVGTENNSETGNDVGIENDSETGNDVETENDSETGNDVGTENDSETGNDVETENDSETGNDAETGDDVETGDNTETVDDTETGDNAESEINTINNDENTMDGFEEIFASELESEAFVLQITPSGEGL